MFISPDIVAVDTAAAKFFNQVREMPLDTVGHLAKGEKKVISTKKSADIPIRIFLNMVDLHLDSLDI